MIRSRAVTVVIVISVVAWALLLLAVWQGWLGPEAGRGAEFCEASRSGWIKQPTNTWSNLGFAVAGLAVARRSISRRCQRRFAPR